MSRIDDALAETLSSARDRVEIAVVLVAFDHLVKFTDTGFEKVVV